MRPWRRRMFLKAMLNPTSVQPWDYPCHSWQQFEGIYLHNSGFSTNLYPDEKCISSQESVTVLTRGDSSVAEYLSSMHEALAMHLKIKTNSQLKSLGSNKDELDHPPDLDLWSIATSSAGAGCTRRAGPWGPRTDILRP